MAKHDKGRWCVWFPAGFGGFLSLTYLILGEAAAPVFYSFLPMCFFFSGAVQLALWRRLDALETGTAGVAQGEPS